MSAPEIELPLTVKVKDRVSMERELDKAVTAVRELASEERRCGILVTRLAVDEFTVALCESVPFGVTREQHDW